MRLASLIRALPSFLACAWLSLPAAAETIAIIGTGNVANALGPALAEAGHRIVYGSRNPDRDSVRALVAMTGADASALPQQEAPRDADVVVLAVPWNVVGIVVDNLGNLNGRIVVDPTNPRTTGDDGLRRYALAGSNAERIQRRVPEARVVKAFNTMTARQMANPALGGGPVSVPIAGNDSAAKAVVARLAADLGFEAVDFGPLRYAHVIEGMYLVWANAREDGRPFEYHLRRPVAD